MKIKKICVEKVEKDTGQVLPLVKTDEKDFFGRNLPMTNRASYLETRRVIVFNKEPFDSRFCFATIPFYPDPNLNEYITHNMDILDEKHNKQRIGLAGLQRKYEDRLDLTAKDALSASEAFSNTKMAYVPLEIPFRLNKSQINKLVLDAESIINKNQNLVLDVHSSQDHNLIGDLLLGEINKKNHFFYVSCGSLRQTENALTCAKIWDITRNLKIGDDIPLIVAKHPRRYQEYYSRVSSSFAFNYFNLPIVAEYYHLVPEEVKKELNKKLTDGYMIYDPKEGRFVLSKFQKMLDERSIIKELFQNNNLLEGLGPYDAVLALNFMLQQIDTSLQNDSILNDNFRELVKNKSGWSVFHSYRVKTIQALLNISK